MVLMQEEFLQIQSLVISPNGEWALELLQNSLEMWVNVVSLKLVIDELKSSTYRSTFYCIILPDNIKKRYL